MTKSKAQTELEATRLELKKLQAELAEQKASTPVPAVNRLSEEMAKLRASAMDKSNTITIKDIHDHRQAKLYKPDGTPMFLHPKNAEYAMEEFAKLGVMLSVTPPTEEQTAEYWKTPHGKAVLARKAEKRANNKKLTSLDQMKEVTNALKAMTDTNKQMSNFIKPKEAVV